MSLMNLINRMLGFQASPEKPMNSLVMLLAGPRQMDYEQVRVASSDAWARHYGACDEASTVVGEAPTFVVSSRQRTLVINIVDGSYVKDPRKVARKIASEPVRKAFLKHAAWIRVDLLRPQKPADDELAECIGLLGKLAAELLQDDCLVLISPRTNRMCLCNPTVKDRLASANPLDAFRELSPAETMLESKRESKPESKTAAGMDEVRPLAVSLEAQRRWPEFLDAFRRQSGQLFSVQAMVSDGKIKERVWIRVHNISGEKVAGLIDSHPNRLTDLKQGDSVLAASSEISDWMFVKGGSLVGGFSERVTAAARTSG